jgi:hypothetical protein
MAETDFEQFTRVVLDEFKRIDGRFGGLDVRIDAIDHRFDRIDNRLTSIDERLVNIETELRDIRQRLDGLEETVASHSGYAKEIDHLLKRVVAIEKHLGLERSIRA